jgi:hypothetical protein
MEMGREKGTREEERNGTGTWERGRGGKERDRER